MPKRYTIAGNQAVERSMGGGATEIFYLGPVNVLIITTPEGDLETTKRIIEDLSFE